jgi:hypothetical protein
LEDLLDSPMAEDDNTHGDRLSAKLSAILNGQTQLREDLQGLTQILREQRAPPRGGQNMDHEQYNE